MDELRAYLSLSILLEIFQGRPWVQAAVALGIFVAVAHLLTALIQRGLLRLVRKVGLRLGGEIIANLHQPLFYSILMVGLAVALALSPIGGAVERTAISALKTVNVLIWLGFFIRLSGLLLKAVAQRRRQQLITQQTLPLFQNLAFLLICAVALYVGFRLWGVDMTAWLASAGVLAVAIGFAAKDTLSNFVAGFFILAESPYKIGDYIVLDTGERGEITEIGIRSTRLMTRDDVELTIPNGIMGNSKIVNESGGPHPKFRIRIPVGVAYGSDVALVKSVLSTVAETNELVCNEPEPRVRFRQFGPSSLDFELLCWVEQPSQRGMVVDLLLTAINQRFSEEGVEIPFVKRDVYIKEMPAEQRPPPSEKTRQ